MKVLVVAKVEAAEETFPVSRSFAYQAPDFSSYCAQLLKQRQDEPVGILEVETVDAAKAAFPMGQSLSHHVSDPSTYCAPLPRQQQD